ncbi:T9SS type A sorting domain-containing protein [Flavobacterium sp.]|uniref:T9SS type A sorting domain-containing protein n=1 Tax=Flavobacterium sp. TaxID=239 RepID=UPI00391B3C1B
MKKLLLLLLFTITVNAQFQTSYPGLSSCFGVYDLTVVVPTILSPVNPNDYTVTFFESFNDAQNNANPILNPTAYAGLGNPIGIRITNNTNNEFHLATITLTHIPIPIANPGELSFCDPTELAIYNLNDSINQIIMGNGGLTVTFYETITDAQLGVNPIIPFGYIPLVNPGTQTLFARVNNTQTGCFATTTLTLNTQNCTQNCQPPTNLVATSITNTSVTLGWTNPGTSNLWEVLILPLGSPAPTSANSGTIAVTNPFTFTGLNSQTCYSFYVRAICGNAPISNVSTWSSALDFCTYDCTNNAQCPESLTLISFFDNNNNGVKDAGENGFNIGNFEYEINNSGTSLFGYPDEGVFYIFDTNPTNSYDLEFTVDPDYAAYFSSSTTYINIMLPTGSGSSTYYFPIIQLQTLNDLEVQITPNGNPRPGFTYGNIIIYKNRGNQTVVSGTITFTKSPVVSIINITQTGTVTTGSGFDYTFSNLAPNEQRYIYVTLQVPTIPTVNLGDLLTNSVTIEPLTGDSFPTNNNSSLSQTVVGSYDPNDKTESHGGQIVFEDFTANDYLYYTIRFENTGTANAEFIRVEDLLHADLDENTFEMLNASHTVNTRRSGNQLTWHFYNIDLPPTVTNPNDSHGYLYFRIKPRTGYAIGDVIPNTASIFFDYNPPIVTNTFNTEFVEFLSNPSFETDNIVLYPNPARDFVTISNANETISAVSIYEISGKRIYSLAENLTTEIIINTSAFAKGLYIVEIITEDNHKINKKLIIK